MKRPSKDREVTVAEELEACRRQIDNSYKRLTTLYNERDAVNKAIASTEELLGHARSNLFRLEREAKRNGEREVVQDNTSIRGLRLVRYE